MKDNQAKYPQLRFKGFTDPWVQRKLSDLFIKGGSGGTPKSTNKAFYDGDIPFLGISDITKSNGFINNTGKHISSDGLNSSAAWIVSKGAISLAMYASVGKLAILNIDAATSQAFYNMIFDDYDLRDLVYQRLNKANELSEWNKLISTGTQSNLNADKVKNFQMYLPKNHDEIKLISTFFKQIDNTIVFHQRKLAKLKKLKQGYLQKLFPKNGSKFPQLRFAGFADAWEQRKLSDAIQLFGGNAFKSSDVSSKGVRWLKIANVGIGKILWNDCAYLPEHFWNIYKDYRINDGDYLAALTRPILNHELKIAHIKHGKALLNQRVAKIIFNENPEFTYQLLRKREVVDCIGNVIAGTDPPNLGSNSLHLITVNFPSIDEQEKIGSFFKQLDETIALHQRKLEKLQELKKGYLQKMFV